jgi:NlpC/P60 family putative phage cell wall peptidase
MGVLALAEARAWIGTPYVHQASAAGAGCDCLGLVRGVWRALYGREPEAVPGYTPDWSECDGRERLAEAAGRHLRACARDADDEPGQVLLFRMRDGAVAKHLGIMGQTGPGASFVHAFTGYGVTESPLSAPWRRRIVARFVFPERVG